MLRRLRDSLTLVVPDDLLHMLGELRYISVKELHSPVKPSAFLIESHPFRWIAVNAALAVWTLWICTYVCKIS